MKRTIVFAVRLVLLIVAYFVCYAAVVGALIPAPEQTPTNADSAAVFSALLAISILNCLVIAYVVSRSRWAGWKLVLTLWFLLFGVVTLMPQIETAVFVKLPQGLLPRLFLTGAVFSAIFSPLAVLILGKRKPQDFSDEDHPRLQFSVPQWIWRLVLIAAAYVFIYFSFGYFIAWQNPAVRAYYGGTDPGSFLTQVLSVWRDTPWLPALQVLRAMLWTALAIPVIRMTKGPWWQAGLAVALLFGVVMNTQLLLPNPLMPTEVRMTHLLETATSNFLFGWLLVWVLRPRSS